VPPEPPLPAAPSEPLLPAAPPEPPLPAAPPRPMSASGAPRGPVSSAKRSPSSTVERLRSSRPQLTAAVSIMSATSLRSVDGQRRVENVTVIDLRNGRKQRRARAIPSRQSESA
jgi:hypothetical protein